MVCRGHTFPFTHTHITTSIEGEQKARARALHCFGYTHNWTIITRGRGGNGERNNVNLAKKLYLFEDLEKKLYPVSYNNAIGCTIYVLAPNTMNARQKSFFSQFSVLSYKKLFFSCLFPIRFVLASILLCLFLTNVHTAVGM